MDRWPSGNGEPDKHLSGGKAYESIRAKKAVKRYHFKLENCW